MSGVYSANTVRFVQSSEFIRLVDINLSSILRYVNHDYRIDLTLIPGMLIGSRDVPVQPVRGCVNALEIGSVAAACFLILCLWCGSLRCGLGGYSFRAVQALLLYLSCGALIGMLLSLPLWLRSEKRSSNEGSYRQLSQVQTFCCTVPCRPDEKFHHPFVCFAQGMSDPSATL